MILNLKNINTYYIVISYKIWDYCLILQKPKLKESETIELENQQLLVMKLLKDFENNLEKIRDIFNNDNNLENTDKIDTDGEDTKCHITDITESQQMVWMN